MDFQGDNDSSSQWWTLITMMNVYHNYEVLSEWWISIRMMNFPQNYKFHHNGESSTR